MDPLVTKTDLREVKEDLRIEFDAKLDGVRDSLSAEIRGLDRGLWIKLATVGVANVATIIGAVLAVRGTDVEPTQALSLAVRVIAGVL